MVGVACGKCDLSGQHTDSRVCTRGMWNNEYVARISRLNERALSKIPLQDRTNPNRDDDNTNASPVMYRIQEAHRDDCSFATHFLDLIMSDTGELRVDSNKRPYSRNARLWVYCTESSTDAPENRTYILDIDPSLFVNDFAQPVVPLNRVDKHLVVRDCNSSTVLRLDATTLDIIRQRHEAIDAADLCELDNDSETHVDTRVPLRNTISPETELELVDVNDNISCSDAPVVIPTETAPQEFARRRLDFGNPTTVNENIRRVLALTECLLNLPSMMPRWGPVNKISDPTKVDYDCLWSLRGSQPEAIVGQYAYRKLRRLEKEAPYASNALKQWMLAYCWLELVVLACFDETTARNRVMEATREQERAAHLAPTDEESRTAVAVLGGDVLSANSCDYPCDADADSSLLEHTGGSRSGNVCKTDKCSIM